MLIQPSPLLSHRFRRVSKWFFKLLFQTSGKASALTFFNDSEADLAYKALDVGWIFDLAAVGTIKFELHILQHDGCVTLHDITRPYSMTLKHACIRGKCTFLVVKNLWQIKRKREKGWLWPTEMRLELGYIKKVKERNNREKRGRRKIVL